MAGAWLKRARRYAARSSTRHGKQTKRKKEPRRAKRNAARKKGDAAKPLGESPFFYSALRAFVFTLKAARLHFIFFVFCFALHCAIGGMTRFIKNGNFFLQPLNKCASLSWLISEGLFLCPKVFPRNWSVKTLFSWLIGESLFSWRKVFSEKYPAKTRFSRLTYGGILRLSKIFLENP